MKTQTKRSFPYITVALIVVAVLVVGMLLYSLLGNLGIFGRLNTVAETTNYSISANEMKVYEYHAAQSQLYQEYLYYSYGLTEDTYGVTTMYSTPDAYINAMLPQYVSYGLYEGAAFDVASQYLLYCELANADSTFTSYDDAALDADIDAYMAELKAAAKANNITMSGYLGSWIGAGISEGDVRSAMKKYFIATEYSEALTEAIKESLTEEELKAYIEDHKSEFYKSEYVNYPLVDKDMFDAFQNIGKEDSNINMVEKLDTENAVKTAITQYLLNKQFDELYKKHVLEAETETGTDNETETTANGAATQNETETETETETEADPDAGLTEEEKATKYEVKQKVLETLLALNKVTKKNENGEDVSYDKHYTSDSTGTDKDIYTLVTTLNKTVEAQIKKVVEGSLAYADLSKTEDFDAAKKISQWLFDPENPAKAGDVNLIEQENTSESSSTCTSSSSTDKKHTFSETPNTGATPEKKVYKCTNAGCTATKTVTTTYTWYLVERDNFLDDEKTKEAYYNLFTDDKEGTDKKTGKDKAEAAKNDLIANLTKSDAELAEFLKGVDPYKANIEAGLLTDRDVLEGVTPGNFAYWAATHSGATVGSSNYYYEAVSDARDEDTPAKTDKLYEWLFDAARQNGDVSIIAADETKDGQTTNQGYYLVYFEGENEETWKRNARTALAGVRVEDKLEEAKTTYNLEMDSEPESETADPHAGHNH